LVYAFVKNKKLYGIISTQKQEVEKKNHLISEALKDIDDSLTYSKFIQNALLPRDKSFEVFKDNFILFKPKDKVSGDFYWLYKNNNLVYFCVADCTGHGVPGALVSVVGANALNSCLKEYKLTEPKDILDKMSVLVEETLSSEERNMKDGMDLTFCRLNLDNNELVYSGANNPLYILSNKGLQILSPNKQPIGSFEYRKPFTQEHIILNSGDCLYLFSDGYADQFGGPNGKKYMYKRLRGLLENVTQLPLQDQKNTLETEFESWKGSHEQIDDVCIVGIRV
jgi:serine phosphatase RsbU (regulator of sigma subunit)